MRLILLAIVIVPSWFLIYVTDIPLLGFVLGMIVSSFLYYLLMGILIITNFLGLTDIDLDRYYPESDYEESNSSDTDDYYNPTYIQPSKIIHSNTINETPENKKYSSTQEYVLKVRAENCKYARLEEIVIEAHNRQEARQKAINMGYRVIQCT